MSRFFVSGALIAALVALTPPAPASGIGVTFDKLAYLTFNAPVQVPGATLRPGTYKFVCDPHRTSMKGTIKVT